MRRSSTSSSAGLRVTNTYSTRTEQPTAMPVAARIHKELLTRVSAGACLSQRAMRVQKMNPHVDGRIGTVVATTSMPARQETMATPRMRATGSLSKKETTPNSVATAATRVNMDMTPERTDTEGLSRPTMNTK